MASMRTIPSSSLTCLLCLSSLCAVGATIENLAEAQARAETLRPEECIRICIDLAQREFDETKAQFAKNDSEKAKLALQGIATHAEKASDGAILARKREKQLEIELRQISHRLGDLKRTLPFEDQAGVQAVMDRMEALRTRLLESMFHKEKK